MKQILIVPAIALAAAATVLAIVNPPAKTARAPKTQTIQTEAAKAPKRPVRQFAALHCKVKGRAVLVENPHGRAFRRGVITFRYKNPSDNWVFVRKRLGRSLRPSGKLTYRVRGKVMPNSPCVAKFEGPVV